MAKVATRQLTPCSPLPRGDGAETGYQEVNIVVVMSCSPLPRGDGAETRQAGQAYAPAGPLAVPYLGAMALQPLQTVRRGGNRTPLAVPYLGAMALKLKVIILRGSETILAVPYLGAMALKPRFRRAAPFFPRTCSPLPRGDGAETLRG